MRPVATLTMNPTIDKTTAVDQVQADVKLRCQEPRREPGGGGINVARVITRLGGTSEALFMAGGPLARVLEQGLDDEGVPHHAVPIEGWTRENLIVNEIASEQQFRFGMPGPQISDEEWRACLRRLADLHPTPSLVVASGSLAPGMSEDAFVEVARVARQMEARLIVDTSGAALQQAVEAGAYLLKPNVRELQELVGEELPDEEEQEEAARQVLQRGNCHAIVLSLGARGALLVTAERTRRLPAPTVPVRSKVGAGDSMVGGIALGLARDLPLEDALRLGIAAGAAAVMTKGTELCRREDTDRIFTDLQEQNAQSHHDTASSPPAS